MTNYDIGAVFAALFTAWLGPKLGPILGIYSVIVIAAIIGSGLSLWRRKPEDVQHPVLFVLLMVGATVICTVPLSLLLVAYLPVLGAQIVVPLMALAISAIGHDWPRFIMWVIERTKIGKFFGIQQQGGDAQ